MWKSVLSLSLFAGLVWWQISSYSTQASETIPSSSNQCQTFDICLRWTLNATDPMQKALYASQGISLWNKSIPQRDLINLLQIRAETLIELFQSTQNQNLLRQSESDYTQLNTLLNGKSYVPFAGLGRVAELRGQMMEANQFFGEAVKTNNLVAWLSRAAYRLRQGQTNGAKSDLESADKRIKQMQRDEKEIHVSHRIWFHQLRADVFQALKQAKQAQLELQAACQLGHQPACQNPS